MSYQNKQGGISASDLSTDVVNATKLGTDEKIFTDLSGVLIKTQNYNNTTQGLIDFSKPKVFDSDGYDFWEFIFPTQDIVLPAPPVGYRYVTNSDAHFRLYGGTIITNRIKFQFNIIMSNGFSKWSGDSEDSQVDASLEVGADPSIDFSWSTQHIATPASMSGGNLKPFFKIKAGILLGSTLPTNLAISEISIITQIFIIKDSDFVNVIATDFMGN